jgi:hypothetical protein
VRTGAVRRVRRGYYASASASTEAIIAVRVGGRLAGPSAARSFGFWSGFDERIHVAVPSNAARLRTNFAPSTGENMTADLSSRAIVLHWLPPSASSECWRASATETLHQMLTWCDTETAVACLDDARTKLSLSQAHIRQLFEADAA